MSTPVFVFAPLSQGAFLALATRITAIALLVIAWCPTLPAQMRGMRATSRPVRIGIGPQVRPQLGMRRTGAIVSRSRFFPVNRFPFRNRRQFNFFLANACFNHPFFDPLLCRRFLFRNSLLFAQPLLLPYPIYADTAYGEPEQYVPTEQDQASDLSGRIDRLTDEVERLREEQESAKNQQLPSQARQAVEPNPLRILVFRDGHRSEIQNYAVVGDTLWALTEEHAKKIPMSDLDLSATKKANADQGLEFP